MIPLFPHFKKITLDDKKDVENFVKNFPPYSDFNFVSLWSYNTQDKIELSFLYENLVIKFTDYITSEYFYTFLGTNQVMQTITTLLEHAHDQKLQPILKLIPEIVIHNNKVLHEHFVISEDLDNHDYILSIEELALLKGNKYGAKRNFVNRFQKLYPNHTVMLLDLKIKKTQDDILTLFYRWEEKTNRQRRETENELTAIQRLLAATSSLNLFSIGIFINDTMCAFSINELVQNNHAIIHFEKADTEYVGIFQYLKMTTAIYLKNSGYSLLNYEQDLGIEGLRKAKQSYHPTHYLRKYIIRHKEG